MSHVLVVASSPLIAETLIDWLSAQGHDTTVVTDFASAKPQLDTNPPDLLVAQVKLGEFNGMHLAIRSRDETPSIVIGAPDCVLQAEASRQKICYLAEPLEQGTFDATARQLCTRVH
jgi:DNA-binding response OmpR family regulator